MQIDLYPPMPSRPCRFCLSLQNGSVFADFDVVPGGRVVAVRVSFDGFGCCDTPDASKMNPRDSAVLTAMVERGVIDPAAERALRTYFKNNCDVIWNDALEEHDLI